ncbi:MAG: MSCRAMM family adhesin SdrC [Treponema sp.]|nr:MSCRAMM family adhesin SdrC [Treponema sp.]
MTYYELLENYLYEKATSEFYDESQLDTLVDEGFVISHEPDTYDYTLIKSLSESKIVVKYEGEYSSPEFMILNGSRDVTHEEVGSISDIDEFLAKDYLAELAAENARTSKLITVGSLEKILDKYDSEKGISTRNGTATINGRQIAFYSDVSSVRSSLNNLQSSVNTTLNKKAEKTHTHKAADITDMPNYARSVNGEEPDADGNVEIDIDAVEEVAELPAETKKKVYLVPEVITVKTEVDCSNVESIMSGVATWLTGETQHPSTVEEFMKCLKATTADKGVVTVDKYGTVIVTLSSPGFVAGTKFLQVSAAVGSYTSKLFDKSGNLIGTGFTDSIVIFSRDSTSISSFRIFTTQGYNSGWVDGYYKSVNAYMEELTLPTSMYFGEDSRTPPAVYAKSVEIATKEALSEATSGADEKAAALGERIGEVESSVTTAKSDISTLTSGQAAVEKSVSDLQTDLQSKIDAINAILTKNNLS